jgi:hypothetical protein
MDDVETKPWTVGEPCPGCAGELKPVPAPTDAQRAAAAAEGGLTPLPPTVDTADPAQIAKFGDLYRCSTCGYKSRVPKAAARSGGRRGSSGD